MKNTSRVEGRGARANPTAGGLAQAQRWSVPALISGLRRSTMDLRLLCLLGLLLSTLVPRLSAATAHPRLLLTPADVQNIRTNLGKAPLFDAEFALATARVEK